MGCARHGGAPRRRAARPLLVHPQRDKAPLAREEAPIGSRGARRRLWGMRKSWPPRVHSRAASDANEERCSFPEKASQTSSANLFAKARTARRHVLVLHARAPTWLTAALAVAPVFQNLVAAASAAVRAAAAFLPKTCRPWDPSAPRRPRPRPPRLYAPDPGLGRPRGNPTPQGPRGRGRSFHSPSRRAGPPAALSASPI